MSAARPLRLLTVCLGNHCRSPFAALVLAELGGSTVDVRSAGTRDRWVGQPAHADMVTAAATAGYDLSAHRGVHINRGLLDWADTVLAMDGSNLSALHTLMGVTGEKLTLYLGDRDVPDPWGKGAEEFTDVVRIIEDGAPRHLP